MTKMDGKDPADPSLLAHWHTEQIRFCDTDMAGHVNNVAYAAFAEAGRVSFLDHVQPGLSAGVVVATVTVNYRKETFFPGEVRIGTRVERVGNSSISLIQGIFHGDICVADTRATIVHVGENGAQPIGEDLRQALVTARPLR